MSVQRYKYGPGVVEAIQYNGTNFGEIYEWCPYAELSGSDIKLNFAWPNTPAVTIVENDWIIRTSKNHYAPGRIQDFAYIPFNEVYESIATTLTPAEVSPDPDVVAHQTRIVADGGVVTDFDFLSELIRDFKVAGCYGLLDALYIPIACKKDAGNLVSKVYDLSPPKAGVYYDVSQANPAKQQLFQANQVDGKPWISFDVAKSGGYVGAAVVPYVGYPVTCFVISKYGGAADGYHSTFGLSLGTSSSLYQVAYNNASLIMMLAGAQMNVSTDGTTVGQFTFLFNGASSTGRRKGVQIATGNAGTLSASTNYSYELGSSIQGTFNSGPIAFAAFVRQAMTTKQRDAVENLLNTKYYPSTVG